MQDCISANFTTFLVDHLPKNNDGKILKTEVREWLGKVDDRGGMNG
jgi:hypothetical protein